MISTYKEADVKFYNKYNPLKNALRHVPLLDSLYVVWSYYRNISRELNFKFPNGVNAPPKLLSPYTTEMDRRLLTSEWDLEILAREIIINAPLASFNRETLRKSAYFAKTFNKLRELNNSSTEIYGVENRVFQEVFRIIQQQLYWQEKYENLLMYVELFSSPVLAKYIENVFDMPINKVVMIGFALSCHFLSQFHHSSFPITRVAGITEEDVKKIASKISKPVGELKELLSKEHKLNEKFFFYKDALATYPIISFKENDLTRYISPIPQLIYWRVFNGLYYDCIGRFKSFGDDFGKEFQRYITKRSNDLNVNKRVQVFEEADYANGKKTIDIQIVDDTANIFVECKAKRLIQKAKEELLTEEEIREQISIILDAVIQGYKTIIDYKANLYPQERNNDKPLYLLVVTLEDWSLPSIDVFIKMNDVLKMKMQENKIPLEMLETYPYKICSAEEYDFLFHVVAHKSIFEVVEINYNDSIKSKWRVADCIRNKYLDFIKENPKPRSKVFDDIINSFKLEEYSEKKI